MKNKFIILLVSLSLLFTFNGCKTKEYIEVPVEKTKIEYVHNTDSIYLHDSVAVYIMQKGDTVFIDRYKYKIKEVYKSDTVCKIDTIPNIVTVEKVTEVNKLHIWQKILMWIGGVGIVGLLMFLMYKLGIWKSLF